MGGGGAGLAPCLPRGFPSSAGATSGPPGRAPLSAPCGDTRRLLVRFRTLCSKTCHDFHGNNTAVIRVKD